MANDTAALNPERWSKDIQETLFVENTAVFLANNRFVNLLAGDSDTVNNPTLSHALSGTYTPGSDISFSTLTAANEQLTVSTWSTASARIDDTEKRQSGYDINGKISNELRRTLSNKIEQAWAAQVTNASWTVDAGNVGGSSGSNISLTTDNAHQVFTAANTKLNAVDVPMANRYAVIGGHTLATLQLTSAGRQTNLGDKVLANGVIGPLFNWTVVYNNNLKYSATLDTTTIFVDTDTVTIGGVVFTADADGAAVGAGHWSIQGNAALCTTQLVNAINNSGTPGVDTFIQLSGEDRYLLNEKYGVVATDNTTNIGIVGYGDIVVSETATPAGNVWSAQKQVSYFGAKGAVDQIVQIPPFIEMDRDPDQFADIIKGLIGHGAKTFAEGARKMVQVNLSAASADGWV